MLWYTTNSVSLLHKGGFRMCWFMKWNGISSETPLVVRGADVQASL